MFILDNSSSSKSHHNVREADLGRLIELVELRTPVEPPLGIKRKASKNKNNAME